MIFWLKQNLLLLSLIGSSQNFEFMIFYMHFWLYILFTCLSAIICLLLTAYKCLYVCHWPSVRCQWLFSCHWLYILSVNDDQSIIICLKSVDIAWCQWLSIPSVTIYPFFIFLSVTISLPVTICPKSVCLPENICLSVSDL